MQRKLVTVPDGRLRQKSSPVSAITPSVTQVIRDVCDTLLKKDDPPGVGLSAVQIGELTRIFVTYLPPVFDLEHTNKHTPPSELNIFINPEIIDHSDQQTYGQDAENPALEGCLSVPALYGPVLRYQTVTVKYQTVHNNSTNIIEKTDTFSNFYARVIQHEYDHLDGILFTDHVKKSSSKLYFDDGNNLIPIPKPEELVKW